MLTAALDCTPLLGQRTGVGMTVERIAAGLGARGDLEVRALAMSGRGFRRLSEVLPAGVAACPVPLPAQLMFPLWRRVGVPKLEWLEGNFDVVHGTNFVVPPTARAAQLVTVHDLTAIRFPQLCPPVALRYPALVAAALSRGAHVHALSEFVAGEIVDHFGVSPERVHVIPLAPVVESGLPPTVERSGSVDQQGHPAPGGSATGGAGGGRPYVLALGTIEPRKDLPSLVRAFDLIAGRLDDLDLRIVGADGWGAEQLNRAIAASPFRQRIHRAGYVKDVAAELAGATVFAYPSVYEGFGIPPLEAMRSEVPVVTTEAGPLPEVVGDAAELVPVGDAQALAGALEKVVTDATRRAQLIERGRRRQALYSWERTTEQLADLYAELAA